jgi:hypothetical protein
MKPGLKSVTGVIVFPVKPIGITACEDLHDLRKRRPKRFDQQMEMICHQRVILYDKGKLLLDNQQ